MDSSGGTEKSPSLLITSVLIDQNRADADLKSLDQVSSILVLMFPDRTLMMIHGLSEEDFVTPTKLGLSLSFFLTREKVNSF